MMKKLVLYTNSLPPPLAGIGKLPALAGRYFGISVSVLLWVFLTVRFGGNTF